jgi:hypothetical protein
MQKPTFLRRMQQIIAIDHISKHKATANAHTKCVVYLHLHLNPTASAILQM